MKLIFTLTFLFLATPNSIYSQPPFQPFRDWGGTGTKVDPFWFIEYDSFGFGSAVDDRFQEVDPQEIKSQTATTVIWGSRITKYEKKHLIRQNLAAAVPSLQVYQHTGFSITSTSSVTQRLGGNGFWYTARVIVKDKSISFIDIPAVGPQDSNFFNATRSQAEDLTYAESNMSCIGNWTLALTQNQPQQPSHVYEDEFEFAIDLIQDTWSYKGTAGRLNLGGTIVKTSQVASGDFCQTGILFSRPVGGVVNPASWFWDVWDISNIWDWAVLRTTGPHPLPPIPWTQTQLTIEKPVNGGAGGPGILNPEA